jgi:hypothetical protein
LMGLVYWLYRAIYLSGGKIGVKKKRGSARGH